MCRHPCLLQTTEFEKREVLFKNDIAECTCVTVIPEITPIESWSPEVHKTHDHSQEHQPRSCRKVRALRSSKARLLAPLFLIPDFRGPILYGSCRWENVIKQAKQRWLKDHVHDHGGTSAVSTRSEAQSGGKSTTTDR
jgi:hypothetical protein